MWEKRELATGADRNAPRVIHGSHKSQTSCFKLKSIINPPALPITIHHPLALNQAQPDCNWNFGQT